MFCARKSCTKVDFKLVQVWYKLGVFGTKLVKIGLGAVKFARNCTKLGHFVPKLKKVWYTRKPRKYVVSEHFVPKFLLFRKKVF